MLIFRIFIDRSLYFIILWFLTLVHLPLQLEAFSSSSGEVLLIIILWVDFEPLVVDPTFQLVLDVKQLEVNSLHETYDLARVVTLRHHNLEHAEEFISLLVLVQQMLGILFRNIRFQTLTRIPLNIHTSSGVLESLLHVMKLRREVYAWRHLLDLSLVNWAAFGHYLSTDGHLLLTASQQVIQSSQKL